MQERAVARQATHHGHGSARNPRSRYSESDAPA
jgi:hypothetical protein